MRSRCLLVRTASHNPQCGCRGATEPEPGQPAKRRRIFEDHLPFSACNQGIKAGRLHQGSLQVHRSYPYEGKVALHGDIKVRSPACLDASRDVTVYTGPAVSAASAVRR